MKRLLVSIAALVLATSVCTVAPAAASASTPILVAASASCPAGETYVKSYTKANGTVVNGYCRKSSAAQPAPMSCPKGETYVKPYKKANGTMVKGYCRKS